MRLQSWNRFHTTALKVTPEVLGLVHTFPFGGVSIEVRLPTLEQVDRGPNLDEIARVGSRWATDNSPIEFEIFKVDVRVDCSAAIELPPQVAKQPANAYDLVSEDQQRLLKQIIENHRGIAERAFEYWLSVMRWVTDDFRIGREERFDYRDGFGGTRLKEMESGQTVWIEGAVITAPGYHRVTHSEWKQAEIALFGNEEPPMYVVLRQDAEEFLVHGDYRRCVIDLCVACETFLRTTVLASLPADVTSTIRRLVEKTDANRYINGLFPELLTKAARVRFQVMKPDLNDLFVARNKILHGGDSSGATSESCRRWLATARNLFSLAAAPVPEEPLTSR